MLLPGGRGSCHISWWYSENALFLKKNSKHCWIIQTNWIYSNYEEGGSTKIVFPWLQNYWILHFNIRYRVTCPLLFLGCLHIQPDKPVTGFYNCCFQKEKWFLFGCHLTTENDVIVKAILSLVPPNPLMRCSRDKNTHYLAVYILFIALYGFLNW